MNAFDNNTEVTLKPAIYQAVEELINSLANTDNRLGLGLNIGDNLTVEKQVNVLLFAAIHTLASGNPEIQVPFSLSCSLADIGYDEGIFDTLV